MRIHQAGLTDTDRDQLQLFGAAVLINTGWLERNGCSW